MLPKGHIIPPEGCIILPEGCLDLRSTASLRQDNAPLRWNNVAFGHYNFHCPSGRVVIISHYFWGQLLSHFVVVDGGPYKAECVYLVFVLRLDY